MSERELTDEDRDINALNDELPTDQWQDDEQDEGEHPLSGEGREEAEAEAKAARYGSDSDDIAEQIAQAQMEKQGGKSKEFDEDFSKPENTLGVFGEEGEPEPAAAPQQQAAPADDPLIELTIRGEKKVKPLSEVIRDAQMHEAADSYLAEARRVFDEARNYRDQLSRGEAPLTAEQNRQAEQNLTDAQREQRRQLHEVITYGTPEEIERAFEQFSTDLVQRATQEVQRQQQHRAINEHIKADIEGAQQDIERTFPDIAARAPLVDGFMANLSRMQREVMARTVENLPDDQRLRFVRSNVTPDRLRSIGDPKKVMEAYVDFVRKGYPLPPVGAVMREAASYTADVLKIQPAATAPTGRGTTPANDPNRGRVQLSPDRFQRKAELSPQTQRASVGTGRTSAPKAATETDFHRQAMAEYREQGFSVPPRRR